MLTRGDETVRNSGHSPRTYQRASIANQKRMVTLVDDGMDMYMYTQDLLIPRFFKVALGVNPFTKANYWNDNEGVKRRILKYMIATSSHEAHSFCTFHQDSFMKTGENIEAASCDEENVIGVLSIVRATLFSAVCALAFLSMMAKLSGSKESTDLKCLEGQRKCMMHSQNEVTTFAIDKQGIPDSPRRRRAPLPSPTIFCNVLAAAVIQYFWSIQ